MSQEQCHQEREKILQGLLHSDILDRIFGLLTKDRRGHEAPTDPLAEALYITGVTM
ncbi:hypothetical protein ACFV0T_28420 [Streptomyces sp. NPDC059582]|uniref:hypothetical protein n=1 Tax=Streptomyces sp. NPDC059582 TaxID=3346875 RepID=UPI00368037E3